MLKCAISQDILKKITSHKFEGCFDTEYNFLIQLEFSLRRDYLTNIARVFETKNQVNLSFLCDYISNIAVLKNVTFKKTQPQL